MVDIEFITGKWYKNLGKDNKCYAKCEKFKESFFYIDCLINPDKEYKEYRNNSFFSKDQYTKAELLTNISEIVHLLPKNHPDLKQNILQTIQIW